MKRLKSIIKLVLLVLILLVFFYCQNNWLGTSHITYKSEKIPAAFDGMSILQISDLHNKEFGKDNINLVKKVESMNPDIIVITGDIIDSSKTNIDVAVKLVEELVKISPTYYVSGNHEVYSRKYDLILEKLHATGAIIMDQQMTPITKDGQSIYLYGLPDSDHYIFANKEHLESLNTEAFNILLSHRPELLDYYANLGVDLVFSGHAHGGQFRLPLVGGLVAPNQGFFPKLTAGMHTQDNTSLIVSRGLGNSIIPVRIFNRPELVLVKLARE